MTVSPARQQQVSPGGSGRSPSPPSLLAAPDPPSRGSGDPIGTGRSGGSTALCYLVRHPDERADLMRSPVNARRLVDSMERLEAGEGKARPG